MKEVHSIYAAFVHAPQQNRVLNDYDAVLGALQLLRAMESRDLIAREVEETADHRNRDFLCRTSENFHLNYRYRLENYPEV